MTINWNEVAEKLKLDLTSLIVDVIGILITLILAKIVLNMLTRFTNRVIHGSEKIEDERKAKEVVTSMTLLRSVGRYTIYFAAVCLIINQLGLGNAMSNVVTAAGVGALIISLGAQSIIKDVIAGTFIIFERQYGVGDFVKINEHEGTVTSLAMRCTYLKNWKGQQIIIPNGQITTVINYSGEFNMAIVDVPVAYEEDTDRVFAVLQDVANKYYEENREICYEEPSVLGINSFDDSSIGFSVTMKAVKRNHFKIQRDLRTLIKKRFDEEGISIPFNQIVVHNGDK
ncbi:MAG: mechanosensitive ion channel family protein [Erysipelotrichaceae bacterium]|nr:mechanosensitive ion channel family protein [Erysipelotrichaceae bacterium]